METFDNYRIYSSIDKRERMKTAQSILVFESIQLCLTTGLYPMSRVQVVSQAWDACGRHDIQLSSLLRLCADHHTSARVIPVACVRLARQPVVARLLCEANHNKSVAAKLVSTPSSTQYVTNLMHAPKLSKFFMEQTSSTPTCIERSVQSTPSATGKHNRQKMVEVFNLAPSSASPPPCHSSPRANSWGLPTPEAPSSTAQVLADINLLWCPIHTSGV